MSRPRVGVNLLWMIPEVVGGSEDYTVRLLDAVAARGEFDLVLFVRSDFGAYHPDLAETAETVVAPFSGGSRVARVLLENTWLPRAAKRAGVDLVHHPGGTVPWRAPQPTALTVHDLQPLVLPGNFSVLKRAYLTRALPRSVQAATRVVATSDYVAHDLADRFGLASDGVAVVQAGPGTVPPRPSEEEMAAVRDRWGIDGPYVIYPAITYGHKNHMVLLRAAALLDGVRVVLPGGSGEVEQVVENYISDNGLDDVVLRLGRIPGEQLNALLWDATALVFPSLFEGFGLPVVEAMARRLPVIVADSTCLPGIAGGAGLVVAPHDVSAWARAIDDVASEPALATDLAARSAARAGQFTSEEGGRRLAAVYREVLAA